MKSILLIGLGRFGKHIATNLTQLGHEVMAIDKDESRVDAIVDLVTTAQIGDSTNEEFMASIGVSNFDACVVAISGDFQSSLETTSLLKELGAKKVVARAERDVQEKFLLRNGADDVVYLEKQMGKMVAIRIGGEVVTDYFKLDESHSIYEVKVPKQWVHKSLAQIDLRTRFNLNVLAIKENNEMNVKMNADTILTETMSLLVLGEIADLNQCFHVSI